MTCNFRGRDNDPTWAVDGPRSALTSDHQSPASLFPRLHHLSVVPWSCVTAGTAHCTALVTPVSAQVDTTPPPPACYLVAMWSGGHTCPLQTPDSDRAWRQGRCLTRLNCQDYWYWRSYSGHNWLRVSSLTIQNIHLKSLSSFFTVKWVDLHRTFLRKRCSFV